MLAAFAAGASMQALPLIVAGLVLAGIGMGLAQPSLSTMVASAVEEKDHGIAVSTMATTTGIGAVAGISILTAMCADVGTTQSFRDGYALGAVFAAFGIIASLALHAIDYDAENKRDPESAAPDHPIPGADDLDEEGLVTIA